ncbi:MAG: tetratricopeptide repeat protein, partial [Acidobacteriaceae bacterium]|nr:tetratricopeptide repeat protein [Acidobacteriaceae bacterium]
VEQKPQDTFARYGLAMEYGKSGDLEQAVKEFRTVIANDPGYAYAYFHGGQTLEKLGRVEEARELYQKGIDAASRKGDGHAVAELQGALDLLPL